VEFERVAKLEPARAVDVIAAATGVRLEVVGTAAGGEVGAAYVRWPDGHRSVLNKGRPDVSPLLDRARAAGVPAPRYELTVPDGAATYLVQTLLPGEPPKVVDRALVNAMFAINGRLGGLLVGRVDLPAPSLFLRSDGPGFCRHEPLARYDRRTAHVLDWVRDVGAERDIADGDDLVHLDFHPANVLTDTGPDGRTVVSGVVDWDGAARGDGRIDLVTLRFDLALRAPELTDSVDERLAAVLPIERWRAYWAHMSLRQLDWSIRHHTADAVDFWLDVVEAGRRRIGDA
jgi:aminoglycoside phosphotransferase (APT) family kinase protein